MRRTKDEATQTRQELLDAALEGFSRQGYHATRLADIAKAAGVTRGAIYHHFGGKAGMYNTLTKAASEQESGVIEAAIGEGGSLREIVTRILSYSLALLEEEDRSRQIFELSLIKTGTDPELEAAHRQRIAQVELLISSTASIMAQGIIRGELRADLDTGGEPES